MPPRTCQDNEIKQPKGDTKRVDCQKCLFCSKIREDERKEEQTRDQSLAAGSVRASCLPTPGLFAVCCIAARTSRSQSHWHTDLFYVRGGK